ncbi:MAG: hypothetical protein JW847_04675 [Candidatus Omnitrophica bacterium]|nr:hypothetical protein [Candidatus Omnitrophota bacterium]
MKNKIDQYKWIKWIKFPKIASGKMSNQGLYSYDGGFSIAVKKAGKKPAAQDLDCWSDLWKNIKATGNRMFRREKVLSKKKVIE